MQAAQGIFTDVAIESSQSDGRCSGIGKQGANRGKMTVRMTQSTQGFDTCYAASGGIDERLKAGERLPVDHEASLVKYCFDTWAQGRHTGLNLSIKRFNPVMLQECSQMMASRPAR